MDNSVMKTGVAEDSPEITLEDFERFLKELLPKYESTPAGKLAYVHSVLTFGLENPAPVEYLARRAIKHILHLRLQLTASESRLREIGDKAHDLSTGPAVHDGYWDIRELAYELLRST